MLLKQLHRHIGIRFNLRHREMIFPPEILFVADNPVVSQGKLVLPCGPQERMVVTILLRRPLGCHSGVANDGSGLVREAESHSLGRLRRFLNVNLPPLQPGSPCGIRPTHLRRQRQRPEQSQTPFVTQYSLIIQQSKDGAHGSHLLLLAHRGVHIEAALFEIGNQLRCILPVQGRHKA